MGLLSYGFQERFDSLELGSRMYFQLFNFPLEIDFETKGSPEDFPPNSPSLLPRPSPAPVFNCLQYAKTFLYTASDQKLEWRRGRLGSEGKTKPLLSVPASVSWMNTITATWMCLPYPNYSPKPTIETQHRLVYKKEQVEWLLGECCIELEYNTKVWIFGTLAPVASLNKTH